MDKRIYNQFGVEVRIKNHGDRYEVTETRGDKTRSTVFLDYQQCIVYCKFMGYIEPS